MTRQQEDNSAIMNQNKAPAFQFYPGDWLRDPTVRAVTPAARGFWIDLLCMMWFSPQKGYLLLANNKPPTLQQVQRMTGTMEAPALLKELLSHKVAGRTPKGIIHSRRMVRDEMTRRARAAGGSLGGNPALMGQKVTPVGTPPGGVGGGVGVDQGGGGIDEEVNLPPNLRLTPPTASPINKRGSPPGKGKKGNPFSPPLPPDYIIEYPPQAILEGYRIERNVPDSERTMWYASEWKKWTRGAQKLLGTFGWSWDGAKDAIKCIEGLGKYFERKPLSWNLNTIALHAYDWKQGRFTENEKRNSKGVRYRQD